jgi:hypothetical protein
VLEIVKIRLFRVAYFRGEKTWKFGLFGWHTSVEKTTEIWLFRVAYFREGKKHEKNSHFWLHTSVGNLTEIRHIWVAYFRGKTTKIWLFLAEIAPTAILAPLALRSHPYICSANRSRI